MIKRAICTCIFNREVYIYIYVYTYKYIGYIRIYERVLIIHIYNLRRSLDVVEENQENFLSE
jgi:hypothetical protein